jgi:hypothetical protein
MKVRKKIFMPRWQRWFMVPVFVGLWLFISYMEFFNPEAGEKMGMVGYIFMSLLFLGMGVMMWLMSSGKLPSYIIEEEIEENKK